MRLSTAIAASGAAVDANGLGNNSIWRILTDNVLTFFNANLRLLAPNPSQDRTGVIGRVFDRAREISSDRLQYSARSNTLLLTDGGHYENLGIYSLAMRHVPWILAFDCTADGGYKYGSLHTLERHLCTNGYKICWENGVMPDGFEDLKCHQAGPKKPTESGPRKASYRFDILKDGKVTSRVIYTKACVPKDDTPLPHKALWSKLSKEDLKEFPHTSTFRLSNWSESFFNAYRGIGFDLAEQAARKAKMSMKP